MKKAFKIPKKKRAEPVMIFCHECDRGGNGTDQEKCACGWHQKKVSKLGCFSGILIQKEREE